MWSATTPKAERGFLLDEARAFSDRLTVYYDRIPQEGGKVRLVVAE
jgi:hypothetical protein